MKTLLSACCMLLMAACARPADPPGPALLFAGGQGDLSAEQRLQVFNMLGLKIGRAHV